MIQVRLDDDAEALVRANKAAHGGSLSKAANRLLRASAARSPAFVNSMSTGTTGAATVLGPPQVSMTSAIKPRRVGYYCSHPLLRRIGDQCVLCGSTV